MKNTLSKKQGGFTLIEMILVIVILGIVGGIGALTISQSLRGFINFQNITAADGDMRVALETMSREIRNIRYSSDITTSTATQFAFTDTSGRSESFSLSGTNLMENSQILAQGVSAMNFTYYTTTLATTTTPSAVAVVMFNITFSTNTTATSTQLIWFPRNLVS